MSLYKKWDEARNIESDDPRYKEFWDMYLEKETNIYKSILASKENVYEGTIEALAEKNDMPCSWMIGFLEGVEDSLKSKLPDLEALEETSTISIEIDFEKLFYEMVKAPAQWLQHLPEWDEVLTEEKRKELTKSCKSRNTIVKGEKIGRNDPCTCGSGKKYKKCCGKNA